MDRPHPATVPHGRHPARLAGSREAAHRRRVRPGAQPHLAPGPDPHQPLHGRPRRDPAVPGEGHAVLGEGARPHPRGSRADPRAPQHRGRGGVAALGRGRRPRGQVRDHLPRGHHHPRPVPVADERAHGRRAGGPRDRTPARAAGPVGCPRHPVALLQGAPLPAAQDGDRGRRRPGGPVRPRGPTHRRAPPAHRHGTPHGRAHRHGRRDPRRLPSGPRIDVHTLERPRTAYRPPLDERPGTDTPEEP